MSWSIDLDDSQLRISHTNSSSHKQEELYPQLSSVAKQLDPDPFQPETPQIYCPQCGSKVRSYFLNPSEKIFMCSRTKVRQMLSECGYPFAEKNLFYNMARRHEEEVVGRLLSKRIDEKHKCPNRL